MIHLRPAPLHLVQLRDLLTGRRVDRDALVGAEDVGVGQVEVLSGAVKSEYGIDQGEAPSEPPRVETINPKDAMNCQV